MTNISDCFKDFRKLGIVARQNFLCCQGCGTAQLAYESEKKNYARKRGYIFYHKQDAEKWREEGCLHLSFGTFDDSDPVPMMTSAVTILRRRGFKVDWDGTAAQRPEVTKEAA